jgi:exodeoxyribonuclease VII small subunit
VRGRTRASPVELACGLTTISIWHYDMDAAISSQSDNKQATLSESEPALPSNYEDAVAELERLVSAMEAGQLPLDRLLGSYQRGALLLDFCRSRLEAVEAQVQVLEGGQLKPWTES